VGVLQAQELRPGLVDVRPVHRSGHVRRREAAEAVGGQRPGRRTGEAGVAAALAEADVAGVAEQDLAVLGVDHDGQQVAHGPRGDEERGLLADGPGGEFLELADGGVLAEDVVADRRAAHGPAHGRRGPGDGVGAEVAGW